MSPTSPGESQRLEREHKRLQADYRQFVDFVRTFPELTRALLETQSLRGIPGLLVEILQRAFQSEVTIVALRRSSAGLGPERSPSFIVAAADGAGVGDELQTGEGLPGMAAQAHRVMESRDWEALPAADRRGTGPASWSRLVVAAPMMVGQDCLGVLAIGPPHRRFAQLKEMLQLIGQVAAYKLHSLETFHEVRLVANLDGLTGLLNKRAITQRLGEAIFEAETMGVPLSIFLFDIDNFKNYNDQHGHLAGDHLLRDLAAVVKANSRRENVLGRFGGEEFLMVLKNCEKTSGLIAAENVCRAIANYPFEHAGAQPLGSLSVSGGVASFPGDGSNSTELLKKADAALYEAKRAGRNRVIAVDEG